MTAAPWDEKMALYSLRAKLDEAATAAADSRCPELVAAAHLLADDARVPGLARALNELARMSQSSPGAREGGLPGSRRHRDLHLRYA